MAGKHTLRGIVDIVTNLVVRVDDLDALPPGSGDVSTDSIFSAKGDLPVGTGLSTAIKLSVGANGLVLTADSAEVSGLKWAAAAGGGDALVANPLSQFAATTAAQLAGVISGETTGTGDLVFATSPVLVTPALGTPTALVGTNITGTGAGFTAGSVNTNANLTGPVTSIGNATAIANGAISNAMLANTAVANLSGANSGDQTNVTGNAGTVTSIGDLTGVVTSTNRATSIANGVITNAMLANSDVANLSGTNTGDNAANTNTGLVHSTGVESIGGVKTFTAAARGAQTAVASAAGELLINLALSNDFTSTLTEDTLLKNPTNIAVGQSGTIFFEQHASIPKNLTYDTFWKFPGGVVDGATLTNSAKDSLGYTVRSATEIDVVMGVDSK